MQTADIVAEIRARRPIAVLIAGATASGKSALACRLAEAVDGVIVNADSMQVYRDLRVITARPSVEEEQRFPHRLYGHIDGADAYSAGRWIADIEAVLRSASEARRLPIIVGGTGLYFKALTEGLSPIPEIPADVRAYWRTRAEALPAAELFAELAARDPEGAALLRISDHQRLTRALEVLDATGRPLREWQAIAGTPVLDPTRCVRLVIAPPRETVHAAVNNRFDDMMAAGGLAEVEALIARQLPAGVPVMRATGVPELARYLGGEQALEGAVDDAKSATRRYVRRQGTWLRRFMADWTWV